MPSRPALAFSVVLLVFFLVAAALPAAALSRPIELAVDATDAPRGVFHSHLVIPVVKGPLTLAYPKWIQGEHAPTGPIQQVAGLTISAAGKVLPWRRDAVDPFLIRLEVPAGSGAIEVTFDYLSPVEGFGPGYGETPNATAHLAIVDWHDLLWFPLGPPAAAVTVRATLRLPAGWQLDTALPLSPGNPAGDAAIGFEPVSLYTLIDAPVLAGDLVKSFEIGSPETPVRLTVAADRLSALAVPEARLAAYRRLPGEAEALFGAHHYRTYHFLVALGSTLDKNGLEHHESSDDRGALDMFTDDAQLLRQGTLLPHEFVHSWNGKHRRPAGLATADTWQPLHTELLWVYEGLTRYLGDFVLTTRSGIRSVETTREYTAWVAANQDRNRPGRHWRPLGDTATSVQAIAGAPTAWTAYRRGLDYYDESLLLWLEVDTVLREKSGGSKSLDDFCRAFFGGVSGPPTLVPYTAEDVYAALGQLVAQDWKGFFAERVEAIQDHPPLAALTAAGWKLVYTDRPNEYQTARAKSGEQVDESFSLGLWLKDNGTIDDIVIGSPAWQAGLGPGMKVVAVDGRKWGTGVLTEEVQAAVQTTAPIELTVEQGDAVRSFKVSYHEGEKYPHLVREEGRADLLAAILAARRP